MAVDFDALVTKKVMGIFGEATKPVYTPVKSQPGQPGYAIDGIFDRDQVTVLDEIAASEMQAAGHSTSAPVLGIRLADLAAPPKQGDRVTIRGVAYQVWDIHDDEDGYADLILRKV